MSSSSICLISIGTTLAPGWDHKNIGKWILMPVYSKELLFLIPSRNAPKIRQYKNHNCYCPEAVRCGT
jgi:hypothetical protein